MSLALESFGYRAKSMLLVKFGMYFKDITFQNLILSILSQKCVPLIQPVKKVVADFLSQHRQKNSQHQKDKKAAKKATTAQQTSQDYASNLTW